MNARNLRQILAIRRTGSLARAAEVLGVAQPTLSKSIARLEEELGVTLFERTSRGSEITPIGELLAMGAERVVADLAQLTRDAILVAGGETGEIRIGVGSVLRDSLVAQMLPLICEQHPALQLYLEVGEGDQLLPKLETRELDIVFCADRPGARAPTVSSTPLFTTPTLVAAAPGHPLTRERDIPVARLAEFRCAGPSSPHFHLGQLMGVEDSENFAAATTNDYSALFPLLWSGNLVMVANRTVLQAEIDAGRAVALDVRWSLDTTFVAVTARQAATAPILRKIIGYALDVGRTI